MELLLATLLSLGTLTSPTEGYGDLFIKDGAPTEGYGDLFTKETNTEATEYSSK